MNAKTKKLALIFLAAAAFTLVIALAAGCSKDSGSQSGEKIVTAISVDARNAKTEFFVGDEFYAQGLGINVEYSDGTSELILPSGDVQILKPNMSEIGKKQVVVQYAGFTAEYFINVSRVNGVSVDLTSARRGYAVGDSFSCEGLTVSLVITSRNELGSEVDSLYPLSVSEYSVAEPDLTSAGIKTATVSYGENNKYTESFDVYVVPAVGADSILAFEGEGAATLYITNRGGSSAAADAEADGWFLIAFGDGSFKMLQTSLGYSASDSSYYFDGKKAEVSGGRLSAEIGGSRYTVGVEAFGTTVFGWEKTIVEIRVEIPAEIKEYVVGGEFKSDGLRAVAVYSDGSEQTLEGGEFAVQAPSAESMNQIGVKSVSGVYTAEDGGQTPFGYQIYCIPEVDWETNRLDLGADLNGSGSTLELFVTERSASYDSGAYWGTSDQSVRAWMLIRNADGTFEMYEYEYYLALDVSSHPFPNGVPEGFNSYLNDAGNLIIEVNGRQFAALDNDYWHYIVIGWR